LSHTNLNYAGEWSYYIKDHLGNTRVVLDNTGGVKAIYDYYPFGLSLRSVVADEDARYKFTGKELDKEGELDWYYFGARYYDPEVGRWLSVDPLSADFPSWSPYNYVFNNPLRLTDPTGMAPPWEAFDIGGGPMAWAERLIWGWPSMSASQLRMTQNMAGLESDFYLTENAAREGKKLLSLEERATLNRSLNEDRTKLDVLANEVGQSYGHSLGETLLAGGLHDVVGFLDAAASHIKSQAQSNPSGYLNFITPVRLNIPGLATRVGNRISLYGSGMKQLYYQNAFKISDYGTSALTRFGVQYNPFTRAGRVIKTISQISQYWN